MKAKSIYSISIKDHLGQPLELSKFDGKKLMIVNVASECGYTPQYEALQNLFDREKENLVILGIPCNDFGEQEPGTEKEIVDFCKKNYGVDFTITQKVQIKTKTPHPLYQWLTDKDLNGVADNIVKWNFHKFLVNENGTLYASLPSVVTPYDPEIQDWLDHK